MSSAIGEPNYQSQVSQNHLEQSQSHVSSQGAARWSLIAQAASWRVDVAEALLQLQATFNEPPVKWAGPEDDFRVPAPFGTHRKKRRRATTSKIVVEPV
jgi:hypothetical protein